MSKKKTLARVFLSVLLVCSMTMNVFAAEVTAGEVDVETTAGNYETVDVTITINPNTDGGKTTDMETEPDGDTTESGLTVEFESTETVDAEGNIVRGESSYAVENSSGTYGANGGTEISTEENAPKGTVDVPLTDVDDPETEINETRNTVKGDPVGTTSVSGDTKDSLAEGEYDYTTETVVSQGSVTVTTKEISVTENVVKDGTDLDYVHGTTEANSENDLIANGYVGKESVDPAGISVKDGYTHVYLGYGNFSKFGAALVCRTGAEGEEPVFVDKNGTPYYVQGDHSVFENRKLYVDDYYINGEHIDEKSYARWDYIQQFVFVDAETGELITTYCADQKTSVQDGYSYIMENVEDADYYDAAQAEMIRSVALNGYWGTKNDEATEAAELGSLDAVKEMMREAKDADGNAVFGEDEIAALTDGMAMTATQYAIWTFSNESNGDKYINAYYVSDALGVGRVPPEEQASVDLIFKLYNHLINLAPTPVENTTKDTIINADNFLEKLSVTVVEKADDHVNNQDTDDTNDAYVTNLTFALVVTPSTENGDDLIVKVLDANGNELASGRVAGEAKEGENVLTPDDNGNYAFTGITMTEGNQNFNITLEGVQHLEQGVYLYTSEVRIDENDADKDGDRTDDLASQTMVGVAEGDREVNVSMNIKFDFSVEDEVVATERVWRTEWSDFGGDGDDDGDDDVTPPGDDDDDDIEIGDDDVPLTEVPEGDVPRADIPEKDVPLVDMFDEEIPLAEAPATGDASALWLMLSALSGSGLLGLTLANKKREED